MWLLVMGTRELLKKTTNTNSKNVNHRAKIFYTLRSDNKRESMSNSAEQYLDDVTKLTVAS